MDGHFHCKTWVLSLVWVIGISWVRQTPSYTFGAAGHGACIMGCGVWIDIAGRPGELSRRVMQANHYILEPATSLLVGSGLPTMLRRKTRAISDAGCCTPG